MRLVNMLRIFCYLGLPVSYGVSPISNAQPLVYMDKPSTQSPLNLALVPTARSQAALLSYQTTTKTKTMAMPFTVEIPNEPVRAGMLKFVAKGSAQQAMTALSVMAMANATTQCVTLTYDKNGNRLSQTVTSIAATPITWGSGVYGCFVWAS